MSDYESMTVDELDGEYVRIKTEQPAKMRDVLAEISAVRRRKVERERIEDRVKAAGLDGVVVIPDSAELSAKGQ